MRLGARMRFVRCSSEDFADAIALVVRPLSIVKLPKEKRRDDTSPAAHNGMFAGKAGYEMMPGIARAVLGSGQSLLKIS